MSEALFGTDGIRGRWPKHPLSPQVARALGVALREQLGPGPVVVGRDTRESGPALQAALLSGLGGEVLDLGVLPTPAVSVALSRGLGLAGVVLTASHNPWQDNGLKVLAAGGGKLSVEAEQALESRLQSALQRSPPRRSARPRRVDVAGLYEDAVLAALPSGFDLSARVIAVDAANGAAWRTAPRVLRALGAEVRAVGVSPSGRNINEGVGALHPEHLAAQMGGADAGIALDGDADRCVLLTSAGEVVDGDALMLLLAQAPGMVGTVMCNAALDRALAARGIRLERVGVGDRQVAERMKALGWPSGGEPSGHVLLADGLPTGDGLLTGLRALAGGLDLQARLTDWAPDPSAKRNLRVRSKPPMQDIPGLQQAIAEIEGQGSRVLVRYSGTEPKLRILVEAVESDLAHSSASRLADLVAEKIGE
ncbi:MAG: phosphoglucosamine mutase [Alphaproteobacteria bacterium]|nr:phosphoglucosamine mutase [Alphaproteobacteria bacterium]